MPEQDYTLQLTSQRNLPGLSARYRSNTIEISERISRHSFIPVLRHELAHAFFEKACGDRSYAMALLSEAFSLWAGEHTDPVVRPNQYFTYASAARAWLSERSVSSLGQTAKEQEALAKVLFAGGMKDRWDHFFRDLLARCQESSFSIADTAHQFRSVLNQNLRPTIPKKIDFLIVEGYSHLLLNSRGEIARRHPVGSILKPTFFPLVPSLMSNRLSRNSLEWNCPRRELSQREWTWQEALVKSCNGFFLDFSPSSGPLWEPWSNLIRVVSPLVPKTMEERVGLQPKVRLSLKDVIALYQWLHRAAPYVTEVLDDTAVGGTLATAAGSSWFVQEGVSLKTGSVRDMYGTPHHSWIVATGRRDENGDPAYFAALHASGAGTQNLLVELRRLIQSSLQHPPRRVEVQILGLVPSNTVRLSCAGEEPMLAKLESDDWKLIPNQSMIPQNGARYVCPTGSTELTFPKTATDNVKRKYAGTLRISEPEGLLVASTLPTRPKMAKARRGSRFILETSERDYLVEAILSEFPQGHTELLKALALVMKNNVRFPRHGQRPICDTTHCQAFGQGGAVALSLRKRVEAIVKSVTDVDFALVEKRRWLPFSLGGSSPWTVKIGDRAIRRLLGMESPVLSVERRPNGQVQVETQSGQAAVISGETFRNQLKLKSFPTQIRKVRNGWLFEGLGEGHGIGLSLLSANAWAGQGASFEMILSRYYPDYPLSPTAKKQ